MSLQFKISLYNRDGEQIVSVTAFSTTQKWRDCIQVSADADRLEEELFKVRRTLETRYAAVNAVFPAGKSDSNARSFTSSAAVRSGALDSSSSNGKRGVNGNRARKSKLGKRVGKTGKGAK